MSDTSTTDAPVADVPTHLWKGEIHRLDHSVIRVQDLEQGVAWYKRLLGLVEVDRRHDRAYLASPVSGKIVLGLVAGGTGLDYVSFRTHGRASIERLAVRLEQAGVAFTRGHEDSRIGTLDALRVHLPTGHKLELLAAEDTKDTLPGPGYVPGALDVRTSHIQFRTLDVLGTSNFLQVLGFKVSGYAKLPDGSEKHLLQFLRMNDSHHQIAILTGTPGLHHAALEFDTADFWRFCDHLATTRIPAEYGPGRHQEGDLLFIYVRDPFGNRLEITGPMIHVGFDYPPQELVGDPNHHMNMWGPQPPESWYHEWT